jgi:uncharacterized surface protein with fasciclin (FAS1) repeats
MTNGRLHDKERATLTKKTAQKHLKFMTMLDKWLKHCLSRRYRRTGFVLLACASLYSCTGYDLDERMPDWLGSSIYEYLNDEGDYTNFVRLIDDLDYQNVLSKTGSKTLFIANDAAFNRFFASNKWGVRRYEDLTPAQKRLLLNGAMINNAYQTMTLSSTEGPKEGDCMRRLTAISPYDSVPIILPASMPNTSFWNQHKSKTDGILCLKDMTAVPMIHFLEKQLVYNKITDEDYNFLFNHTTNRQSGDASVNGITIEGQNIKCLNGFVHQMAEVMTPLDNMAEIINSHPTTTAYSQLLERFSAPYYSAQATSNYNRLNNTNVDSVYQKRYFSDRSQGGAALTMSPANMPVPGRLKFDPGWNSFFSSTVGLVSNDVALQENMGLMLVPTDAALERYWNEEGGKVLKNYYRTWDNVPDNVLAKLINNNMHNSFIASVPSKFVNVLNDANNEMGLTEADIDSVILGCNGAIYLTNKVFSPTTYASVSFPALINDNMNVFYWAIEQLEYYAYLNSMESYYSFFIPTNEALLNYIDPVSFGQTTTKLYRFWYDPMAPTDPERVQASIWTYDLTTRTRIDSLGLATYAQITNRLKDMLDYHIVIGNVEDGNTYYRTKGGGTLKIEKASQGAGNMTVAGGFQLEKGQKVTVTEVYDESNEGNGKTYILESEPLMTGEKAVFDVLSERPEFAKFLSLLQGSSFLETVRDKTYACGSTNISLLNTYHYTVYVPTNASIQALQDAGKLPTWEQVEAEAETSVKDSLNKVISDFLKYHIQDNAVFIGSGNQTGEYETACINPVTQRFYKLNVTADNNGITIKDLANKTRQVTGNPALRNLMAREYQYNNKDVALANEIETSSYVVIHQIDEPLSYDPAHFAPQAIPAPKNK